MSSDTEPRRVDISMTLLTEMMEHPLDPGYAEAHARRPDEGPARSTTLVATAFAAVAAGALLVTGVLALRAPGEMSTAAALADRVEQRAEAADATAERIETLRTDIAAIQASVLAPDDIDLARLERLQVAAGSIPVTGPGVSVTMDDASTAGDPVAGDPRDAAETDDGRVLDVDLQVVVNGLWAAGAEAISVNDVRLTTLASIRNAGDAVLVDQQPTVPPYEITAIGPSQRMQTRFADSASGQYLSGLQQNYGVRASVTGVDEAEVPASASLRLRYARAAPPATPGRAETDQAETDTPATDAPEQEGTP